MAAGGNLNFLLLRESFGLRVCWPFNSFLKIKLPALWVQLLLAVITAEEDLFKRVVPSFAIPTAKGLFTYVKQSLCISEKTENSSSKLPWVRESLDHSLKGLQTWRALLFLSSTNLLWAKCIGEHSFWKNSEQYTILTLTIIFQYTTY